MPFDEYSFKRNRTVFKSTVLTENDVKLLTFLFLTNLQDAS